MVDYSYQQAQSVQQYLTLTMMSNVG